MNQVNTSKVMTKDFVNLTLEMLSDKDSHVIQERQEYIHFGRSVRDTIHRYMLLYRYQIQPLPVEDYTIMVVCDPIELDGTEFEPAKVVAKWGSDTLTLLDLRTVSQTHSVSKWKMLFGP